MNNGSDKIKTGVDNSAFFCSALPNGGVVHGIRGGDLHVHDYDDLEIGHIKDQTTGKVVGRFNNFNSKIDELLTLPLLSSTEIGELLRKTNFKVKL